MTNLFLRAYATIPEFIKHILNWPNFPDFPINTYGTFVALGFLAAAVVSSFALKYRGKLGILKGFESDQIRGEKAKPQDFIGSFILWFIIGFKFIGTIIHEPSLLMDGQNSVKYILSLDGFFIWGLVSALAVSGYEFYQKKRKELPKPEPFKEKHGPEDYIGELVFVAAIFGVVGASVFEIIQPGSEMTLVQLFSDPMNFLSGLTILGGLTFGIIGVLLYCWYRKLKPFQIFDSISAGYILAYGIGRLGCHFSGDGDWGKENFSETPGFLPDWAWSNTYAHNVNNAGDLIPECVGNYCSALPQGVWPTSIYEFLMCLVMFALLWSIQKKFIWAPGFLFSVLFIVNGVERYLIEIIRVTDKYENFFNLTQAQIISVGMIILGIAGVIYLSIRYKKEISQSSYTELKQIS